ncbi:hypothetical protein E4T56_gene15507, partial [Termitomyces sp. T112]
MVEEPCDPLPKRILADRTGAGQGLGGVQLGRVIFGEYCIAPRLNPPGADHAQQAHIILDARHTRRRAGADLVLERFHLALALRAGGQHDAGVFLAVDVRGGQEQRIKDRKRQFVLLGQIAQGLDLIRRGIERAFGRFRPRGHMGDAIAGQKGEMIVTGRAALTAQFHFQRGACRYAVPAGFAPRRLRHGRRRAGQRPRPDARTQGEGNPARIIPANRVSGSSDVRPVSIRPAQFHQSRQKRQQRRIIRIAPP